MNNKFLIFFNYISQEIVRGKIGAISVNENHKLLVMLSKCYQ
jgi:hypothetical protein